MGQIQSKQFDQLGTHATITNVICLIALNQHELS